MSDKPESNRKNRSERKKERSHSHSPPPKMGKIHSDREDSRKSDAKKDLEQSHTIDPDSVVGNLSLSISESNKLRLQLGLKPLRVDSKESDDTNISNQEEPSGGLQKDVHMPAANWTAERRSEKLNEKLTAQRAKRHALDKLKSSVTPLAEPDDDIDSTERWISKTRDLEKMKTLNLSKKFDEMDEEAENCSLPIKINRKPFYDTHHLGGLMVEHDINAFEEGRVHILTLKDKNILEEMREGDEALDTLVNVDLIDSEAVARSNRNKRLAAVGWNKIHLTLDEELQEQLQNGGNIDTGSFLLPKYEGEKPQGFKLNKSGTYKLPEHELSLMQMRNEMRARFVNLDSLTSNGQEPRLASDYYTEAEIQQSRIRRRTRKVRNIRQTTTNNCRESAAKEKTESSLSLVEEPEEAGEIKNETQYDSLLMNEEDILNSVFLEPDEAQEDLQRSLARMRKVFQSKTELSTDNIRELNQEISSFLSQNIVKSEQTTKPASNNSLILDSTREYCRNIGLTLVDNDPSTISSTSHATSMDIANYSDLIESVDVKDEPSCATDEMEVGDSVNTMGGWRQEVSSEGSVQKKKSRFNNSESASTVTAPTSPKQCNSPPVQGLFDDEPILNTGLASALKLCEQKGYLDKEKAKYIASTKVSELKSRNFVKEEIRYDDIDAKFYEKRTSSGPLIDLPELKGYKPDVKLKYMDSMGRPMTSKEAFRQLSHDFHGKGSGQNKIDSRLKKLEEEFSSAKMSRVDTPLGSMDKLHAKLEHDGMPYVVLSGKNSNIKKLSK